MHYDGPHMVNDEPIDYDAWPLYGAPGVDAPLGTGRMKFAKDGDSFELDFGVTEDDPLVPMRVIG